MSDPLASARRLNSVKEHAPFHGWETSSDSTPLHIANESVLCGPYSLSASSVTSAVVYLVGNGALLRVITQEGVYDFRLARHAFDQTRFPFPIRRGRLDDALPIVAKYVAPVVAIILGIVLTLAFC